MIDYASDHSQATGDICDGSGRRGKGRAKARARNVLDPGGLSTTANNGFARECFIVQRGSAP